jgi:hypothetical protein
LVYLKIIKDPEGQPSIHIVLYELFLYFLDFPIRGSNSYFIGANFMKLYFWHELNFKKKILIISKDLIFISEYCINCVLIMFNEYCINYVLIMFRLLASLAVVILYKKIKIFSYKSSFILFLTYFFENGFLSKIYNEV